MFSSSFFPLPPEYRLYFRFLDKCPLNAEITVDPSMAAATLRLSDATIAVDASEKIRLSSVSLSVILSMLHRREISAKLPHMSSIPSRSSSDSRFTAYLAVSTLELSESDLLRPER